MGWGGDVSNFFGDKWGNLKDWGETSAVKSVLDVAAPALGMGGALLTGATSAAPFFLPTLVDKLGGSYLGLDKDQSGNLAKAAGLVSTMVGPKNAFTPLAYMAGQQVNEANRQNDWTPTDLQLPTGALLKDQTDENLKSMIKKLGGLNVVEGVSPEFSGKDLTPEMLKRIQAGKYLRAGSSDGKEYFVKRDKDTGQIMFEELEKRGSEKVKKLTPEELAEWVTKTENAGYSKVQPKYTHK